MKNSQQATIRIGVISDSHLTGSEDSIEQIKNMVKNVLAPVDMILHAGDLEEPEILRAFNGYSFHVVKGNMDGSIQGLPKKKVIQVGDFSIGLIHGGGSMKGLEDLIYEQFTSTPVDCIVYGHTHTPVCHRHNGILFFNPGSATQKRDMDYCSVGFLEIGVEIKGSIIRLD